MISLSARLSALAKLARRFERSLGDLSPPTPPAAYWNDRGRSALTPEKIAEQSDEALRLRRQVLGH